MRNRSLNVSIALLALTTIANADTFRFATDPFASDPDVLTTPGRQVVGGEPFIEFDPANDVFSVAPEVFPIGNDVLFANDIAPNLPTGGVNFVVLQSFDNDNDPLTPFGAGTAANLIAAQINTSGAGFFIYFNQGLDLPRLVFSTDLSDETADLKIIARMINLTGQAGRDAFPSFTASNFAIQPIPEPSSILLMTGAGAILGIRYIRRRKQLN